MISSRNAANCSSVCLILSFTEYTPLQRGAPTFVGLENYLALLGDSDFLGSLWVTARYTLQVLPPTVAIALVLAMLANRPFRGVGIFRSALYVPHIVSLTAVSMVWLWMYSQNGLFNEILGVLDIIFAIIMFIVVFSNPGAALIALAWIIAIYTIIFGIFLIIMAFAARSQTKKAFGN